MTDATESGQVGALHWAKLTSAGVKTHTGIRTCEERSPPGCVQHLWTADIHLAEWSRCVGRRWVQSAEYHNKSPLAALDHFKLGTSASINFMWRGRERLGPTQGSFFRFHEPTKASMVNYMCCQKQRWFPPVHVKGLFCCDAFPWPQSTMEAQRTVACAAVIKRATCGSIQSYQAHSCVGWNIS